VGTKNKSDCRSHYFATYVNVPTAPLPDLSAIGRCKPIEPPAKAAAAAAAKAAAAGAAAADDAPDAADGGVSERTFLKADGSGEWGVSSSHLLRLPLPHALFCGVHSGFLYHLRFPAQTVRCS
jgi:hypothetical protein